MFSDYEQDTDPDTHQAQADSPHGLKVHPLRRTRGRRQDPHLSCPSEDALPADTSSTLDSLFLDGRHRQRRRSSEPAIAYVAKFGPCVSGSNEGLTGEDEDGEEELSEKPSSHTVAHTHSRGETTLNLRGVRSTALEASSSSLSSTPTSPAPTRSSLDSPDSLDSDHTWATRRGLHPNKTHLPSNSSFSSVPSSVPSTTSSALTSAGHPDQGPCPKEPLNWGTLKSCRGLHPNLWLKKGRRLSLTTTDNLEDEDKTGVSLIPVLIG